MKKRTLLLWVIIFGAFFTLASCSCGKTPTDQPDPIVEAKKVSQDKWQQIVNETLYNATIDVVMTDQNNRQINMQTKIAAELNNGKLEGNASVEQNGTTTYYTIVDGEAFYLTETDGEWIASKAESDALNSLVFQLSNNALACLSEYENFHFDEATETYTYKGSNANAPQNLTLKIADNHFSNISYTYDSAITSVTISAIGKTKVELPVSRIMVELSSYYTNARWDEIINEALANATITRSYKQPDKETYSTEYVIDLVKEGDEFVDGIYYYQSPMGTFYIYYDDTEFKTIMIGEEWASNLDLDASTIEQLFNLPSSDPLTNVLSEYHNIKYDLANELFIYEKMIDGKLSQLAIKIEDDHIVSIEGTYNETEYANYITKIGTTVVELPEYNLAPENAKMNVNKEMWRDMLTKYQNNYTKKYTCLNQTKNGMIVKVNAEVIGYEYAKLEGEVNQGSDKFFGEMIVDDAVFIKFNGGSYQGEKVTNQSFMDQFNYEPLAFIDYYSEFAYNQVEDVYEATIDNIKYTLSFSEKGYVKKLSCVPANAASDYLDIDYYYQGATYVFIPSYNSPLSEDERIINDLKFFVVSSLDSATYQYENKTTSTLITDRNVISYSTEYLINDTRVITKEIFDDNKAYFKKMSGENLDQVSYLMYDNQTNGYRQLTSNEITALEAQFTQAETPLQKLLNLLLGQCEVEKLDEAIKVSGKTIAHEQCAFLIHYDSSNEIDFIIFEYLNHRGRLSFAQSKDKVSFPSPKQSDGLQISSAIIECLAVSIGDNYTLVVQASNIDLIGYEYIKVQVESNWSIDGLEHFEAQGRMDSMTMTGYFDSDENECYINEDDEFKQTPKSSFFEVFAGVEVVKEIFVRSMLLQYDEEDCVFRGSYQDGDYLVNYTVHIKDDKIHYMKLEYLGDTILAEFQDIGKTNINIQH